MDPQPFVRCKTAYPTGISGCLSAICLASCAVVFLPAEYSRAASGFLIMGWFPCPRGWRGRQRYILVMAPHPGVGVSHAMPWGITTGEVLVVYRHCCRQHQHQRLATPFLSMFNCVCFISNLNTTCLGSKFVFVIPFYTPVLRRDVLWYGAVCPSVCRFVRPVICM